MDDIAEIPINESTTESLLPIVGDNEPFDPAILPQPLSVIYQMSQPGKEIDSILHQQAGISREHLVEEAQKLLPIINGEMMRNENRSRHPTTLEDLKLHAGHIKAVALITRPGTYHRMNKTDDPAYNKNEMLYGAERLNDDAGAALAIAVAGMQTGILSEEEIQLFLDVKLFTGTDPKLESLKNKAYEALRKSGIRIVYTGKPSEANDIKQKVYSEQSTYKPFIPLDVVDFLDSERITDTESQAKLLDEYLAGRSLAAKDVVMVTDAVHVSRLGRFAAQVNPDLSFFHVRPTSTKMPEKYAEYATGEMRGAYRGIMEGKASRPLLNTRFI